MILAEPIAGGATGARSVARVMNVLELVAAATDPPRVSDVAEALELPVATAFAVLRNLTALGYLVREPDRRYAAGPALVRLAAKVTTGVRVIDIARPELADLAARLREDVYLAIPDDRGIAYVTKIEASPDVRLNIALGAHLPFHSTAVGKLYLALAGEAHQAALFAKLRFPRYTKATIQSKRELERQVREAGRTGYATSDSESVDGIAEIATPVYDAAGRFVAAVHLSVPRVRYVAKPNKLLRAAIVTAQRISDRLGASPKGSY